MLIFIIIVGMIFMFLAGVIAGFYVGVYKARTNDHLFCDPDDGGDD